MLDKCFNTNCSCDFREILNKLGEVQHEQGDNIKIGYCPECGQQLIQDCPLCQKPIEGMPHDSVCPHCNCELAFCNECGRVNSVSRHRCQDCDTLLTLFNNVFFANHADCSRTNVYLHQNDIFTNHCVPKWSIGSEFSEAAIRNGIVYFWKRHNNANIRLVWRDISIAVQNGVWEEEKFGDIYDISIEEIENVEIFNQYILTSAKNSIGVHSVFDGKQIKKIYTSRDLFEGMGKDCLCYSSAIFENTLILIAATNVKQRIFSLNLDKNSTSYNQLIQEKEEVIDHFVKSKAPPAIVTGNCVYFSGYNSMVYKISLIKDSNGKPQVQIGDPYIINFPNLNIQLWVSQLVVETEELIYLTATTDTNTYLFLSKGGSQFALMRETGRFEVGKVSFLDKSFYIFEKDIQGKIHFSSFRGTNTATPVRRLSDFNSAGSIQNYYLVVRNNTPYLVYMQKGRYTYELQVICRAISGDNVNAESLMGIIGSDKSGFLIFENYVIVCDRHETYGQSIIVQKWWPSLEEK